MAKKRIDAKAKASGWMFRVIVADDDPVARKLLQHALNQHGMEVLPVKTCAELHEEANVTGVDAILLDLWMPDQNGIEGLRQLCANGVDIPVIMITGEQKAQHAVEAMQAGAYHYLLKPLDPEEVYLVTHQAVQAYRARSENSGLREALGSVALESKWVGSPAVSRKVLDVARHRSNPRIMRRQCSGRRSGPGHLRQDPAPQTEKS